MSANRSPEPATENCSFMTVDAAAREISERLKGSASVAVETERYGIVRVIDVGTDEEEQTVSLYAKDRGTLPVRPAEISGLEVDAEFSVGDRVLDTDENSCTIIAINQGASHMQDWAAVRLDSGTEKRVNVGGLTLLDDAVVECAGDDCGELATEEIEGCMLGSLDYTVRVCESCARDADEVRRGH